MGVSGCGKSTIASMLAHRLNWIYEEGDWFHPQSNVEKMHSGVPLTDEDRWPWLHGIAAWIDATRRVGNHGTIATRQPICDTRRAAGGRTSDRRFGRSASAPDRRGDREETRHRCSPIFVGSRDRAIAGRRS